MFALALAKLLFHGGQLFLQLRQAAVLDLRGQVQVAGALGGFVLAAGLLKLAVEDGNGVDGGLFVLPARFEFGGLFAQIGQLALEVFEALARGLVLLLAQGGLLNLQLHDLPFQLVNLRRHGIQFHAQARGGFVHQIHRLVRQETVGNVTMGKGGGGDQGGVLDADAVMDLVAFLEAAQDGDGLLHAGFANINRLETALQGGVFFDVLAVFVQGGGADATKFAAGQGRFEHVGGVVGPFGRAGADNGVQFVNEQQHAPLTGSDFLQERLEALLEFAAVLGSGNHGPEVQRHQALVLEGFRHVPADNAAGQTLDDGGLAGARLANQDGVVLGAAGQHLHDTANFLVAADDGINLAGAGQGGQVAPVFFQGLKFVFGIGIGHALVAAQIGQDGVALKSLGLENLFQGRAALFQKPQQKMLRADVFVAQFGGLGLGGLERFFQGRAEEQVGCGLALDFDFAVNFLLRRGGEGRGGHAQFLQERGDEAVRLLQQRAQQMFGADFLIGMAARDFLRSLERFLCFNGQLFRIHAEKLRPENQPVKGDNPFLPCALGPRNETSAKARLGTALRRPTWMGCGANWTGTRQGGCWCPATPAGRPR